MRSLIAGKSPVLDAVKRAICELCRRAIFASLEVQCREQERNEVQLLYFFLGLAFAM